MTKNYLKIGEDKLNKDLRPPQQTIDFLLAYSQSVNFEKSGFIKEIRFDKN